MRWRAFYELGNCTMWAPAIVHFAAQTAIKIVDAPEDYAMTMATTWMAACLVVPWSAFAPLRGVSRNKA